MDAALEGADPGQGRGDVGGLGVVDVEDVVALAHALEPMRDTLEAAQPLGHVLAGMPAASAAAAAPIAFSTLWAPSSRSSDASSSASSPAKMTPPRMLSSQSGSATPSGASDGQKRTRRAQPPRSRSASSGSDPL